MKKNIYFCTILLHTPQRIYAENYQQIQYYIIYDEKKTIALTAAVGCTDMADGADACR